MACLATLVTADAPDTPISPIFDALPPEQRNIFEHPPLTWTPEDLFQILFGPSSPGFLGYQFFNDYADNPATRAHFNQLIRKDERLRKLSEEGSRYRETLEKELARTRSQGADPDFVAHWKKRFLFELRDLQNQKPATRKRTHDEALREARSEFAPLVGGTSEALDQALNRDPNLKTRFQRRVFVLEEEEIQDKNSKESLNFETWRNWKQKQIREQMAREAKLILETALKIKGPVVARQGDKEIAEIEPGQNLELEFGDANAFKDVNTADALRSPKPGFLNWLRRKFRYLKPSRYQYLVRAADYFTHQHFYHFQPLGWKLRISRADHPDIALTASTLEGISHAYTRSSSTIDPTADVTLLRLELNRMDELDLAHYAVTHAKSSEALMSHLASTDRSRHPQKFNPTATTETALMQNASQVPKSRDEIDGLYWYGVKLTPAYWHSRAMLADFERVPNLSEALKAGLRKQIHEIVDPVYAFLIQIPSAISYIARRYWEKDLRPYTISFFIFLSVLLPMNLMEMNTKARLNDIQARQHELENMIHDTSSDLDRSKDKKIEGDAALKAPKAQQKTKTSSVQIDPPGSLSMNLDLENRMIKGLKVADMSPEEAASSSHFVVQGSEDFPQALFPDHYQISHTLIPKLQVNLEPSAEIDIHIQSQVMSLESTFIDGKWVTPLPTPQHFELKTLTRLDGTPLDADIQIFEDAYGNYLLVSPQKLKAFTFKAGYQLNPAKHWTPRAGEFFENISSEKVARIIPDLEDAGFKVLSNSLREEIKKGSSISLTRLEEILADTSTYTKRIDTYPVQGRQDNPFRWFSQFLRSGVLAVQCNNANNFSRLVLAQIYLDEAEAANTICYWDQAHLGLLHPQFLHNRALLTQKGGDSWTYFDSVTYVKDPEEFERDKYIKMWNWLHRNPTPAPAADTFSDMSMTAKFVPWQGIQNPDWNLYQENLKRTKARQLEREKELQELIAFFEKNEWENAPMTDQEAMHFIEMLESIAHEKENPLAEWAQRLIDQMKEIPRNMKVKDVLKDLPPELRQQMLEAIKEHALRSKASHGLGPTPLQPLQKPETFAHFRSPRILPPDMISVRTRVEVETNPETASDKSGSSDTPPLAHALEQAALSVDSAFEARPVTDAFLARLQSKIDEALKLEGMEELPRAQFTGRYRAPYLVALQKASESLWALKTHRPVSEWNQFIDRPSDHSWPVSELKTYFKGFARQNHSYQRAAEAMRGEDTSGKRKIPLLFLSAEADRIREELVKLLEEAPWEEIFWENATPSCSKAMAHLATATSSTKGTSR